MEIGEKDIKQHIYHKDDEQRGRYRRKALSLEGLQYSNKDMKRRTGNSNRFNAVDVPP